MAELYKTRPNDKYKPRFFYLILSDAKEKRIMIYPEDYGIDKNNDKEIVILQKTDYTAQDTKNEEISLQVISKAKEIFLNLSEEQINESLQQEANRRNKENTKANKDYRGDSKNYFLQLKIAEKSTLFKSESGQVPVKMGDKLQTNSSSDYECRDLIWGNKLSCQERKKVIEVCSNIWGETQKMERANMLMAVMHIETEATFNPSKENGRVYVGLVQFHSSTAEGLGSTYGALKKMTFIEQMEYVEKYLQQNKDKMNTLVDFYLQVVKPNAVGNGNNPNYIVFDESIEVPDGDGSKTSLEQRKKNITREPWVTKYGYASNPPFMKEEGEYTKRKKWVYTRQQYEQRYGFYNGKTYIWEIEKAIDEEHYQKGITEKYTGQCVNEPKEDKKIEVGNRAPWMQVALKIAIEMKGCREGIEPMYSNAKKYLKYCNNSFEPTDGTYGPWCSSFMNWCINESINTKTGRPYKHERSASSLRPITSDQYKKIDKPIYGCIVVYKHTNPKLWLGHTGFLYGMTKSNKYILLGGNQSDTIMFSSYGEYTSSKTKNKKFYGFYIPADYEITENDLLGDKDVYENEDVVNAIYGINNSGEQGKTI